ncbi:MAG: TonB-dependent receptor [Desulfobacterales bacterium]|nr:TonB-dependent receptor [Desulfobacterales bacterium]
MKKKFFYSLILFFIIFAMNGNSFGNTDIKDIDALLQMDVEDLLKIKVISASKHEQGILAAPAALSVITSEDIKKYGYTTVGEALNQASGVYMSSDRSNEYGIIRGIHLSDDYNKRLLVLVNGHALNNGMTFEAHLGNELGIPMNSIERIEVMRGGSSVMYGTNAFFGIVNIILKDKSEKNNRIYLLESNIGAYELWDNSVLFLKKFDDSNKLFLCSSLRYNEGKEVKTTHNYQWSYYRATWDENPKGSGLYQILKGDKAKGVDFDKIYSFLGSYTFKNFELSGKYTDVKEGMPLANWRQVFDEDDKEENDESGYLEAKYSNNTDSNLKFSFKSFANWYKYSNELYYHEPDETEGGITYMPDYDPSKFKNGTIWKDRRRSKWNGIELQVEKNFFDDKANVIAGFEYIRKYNKFDYNNYTFDGKHYDEDYWIPWHRNDIDVYGAYSEVEYAFTEKLKFYGGLRWDKITDFNSEVSPRVAFILSPSESYNYKLIASKSFRTPGYTEYDYDDGYIKPNPSLKPETIYSFDFIIGKYFKDSSVSIDFFYSSLKDMIAFNEAAFVELDSMNSYISFGRYQNLYSVKNYGVEIELKGKIQQLSYFFNTAFTESKIDGKMIYYEVDEDYKSYSVPTQNFEKDMKNTPFVSSKLGIAYSLSKLDLALTGNYISKRKINQPSNIDDIGEVYPNELKENITIDFNGNLNKLYKGFSLSLAVKDIFNSKRQNPVPASANHLSLAETEGRMAILKIKYAF